MDTIKITPNAKRSGMIMPLVATIVVFIFLLGIAMLKIGFSSRFTAARTTTEIAARGAADAGLAMAMHLMDHDLVTPSEISYAFPNTRATFTYYVTRDPKGFFIRSVGTSGNMSKTVYAMTWARSFWSYAIAVQNSLEFKSKITLDVWPPGTTPVPTIATTSTMPGAVDIGPNVEIPGDIVVGAGSNPSEVVDTGPNSEVHGDMYPLDNDIEFPPVSVPAGLPPLITWDPNSTTVLPGGVYAYFSIDLKNAETIRIIGDVTMYVDGLMKLRNGAILNIDDGSSLVLYLGGSLIADNGSFITNDENDARNLKIYGTPDCRIIDLKNSGDLCAAIYAPSANLLIYNDGKTTGAFVGNNFEMKNSGEFYYDTRLAEGEPTEGPVFFQIERWWERGDDLI